MSLLEILCSSWVLRVLGAFFIFKGLWWKFFGALEVWIRRASLFCGLLRFLEAFELDSSELWDLGRWFGLFLFECSSYSKVCGGSSSGLWRLEFVEFHQCVVSWSSWRLQGLVLAELLDFWTQDLFPVSWSFDLLPALQDPPKCLRKASIYRSLGVGEQHVAESD